MTGSFRENDLVLIIHKDRRYMKRLEPGKSFHGRGGALQYSDVVGGAHGSWYGQYQLYAPTFEDIIMLGVRRETQIVYPKDAAYISFKLDLKPGSAVLEVGTGSGALTLLFSRAVGLEGRVVSVEKEARHQAAARKNLQKFGEFDNTELVLGDIVDYGGEGGFDAAFVDVREPWTVMEKVWDLIRGSRPVGVIVPTANQVSDTLRSMETRFGDVEAIEIMQRKYKTVADRLRPTDRMVAHTGYLMFGRKIAAGAVAGRAAGQDTTAEEIPTPTEDLEDTGE